MTKTNNAEDKKLHKYLYVIEYKGPKALDYGIIAIGESFIATKKYISKHHRRAYKFYKSINNSFRWEIIKHYKNSSKEIDPKNDVLTTSYNQSFIPNKIYNYNYAYKWTSKENKVGHGYVSYKIFRFDNDNDDIIEL